ncbi:ferredoxin [Candidatus Woesearchaeota archaeon]|jgi:ferredoxin|nr:ferredoxin [Candidatus Woesearchaeota archaeon]MBT7237799.1 ferredoxin [Candidatus Woesearchaeota archaeon]
MKKCKFVYDRENCIGCGSCAALDSKNWKMKPDGKSSLTNSKEIDEELFEKEFQEKDLDKNMEVAQACPVNVIHLEKDKKRLI